MFFLSTIGSFLNFPSPPSLFVLRNCISSFLRCNVCRAISSSLNFLNPHYPSSFYSPSPSLLFIFRIFIFLLLFLYKYIHTPSHLQFTTAFSIGSPLSSFPLKEDPNLPSLLLIENLPFCHTNTNRKRKKKTKNERDEDASANLKEETEDFQVFEGK